MVGFSTFTALLESILSDTYFSVLDKLLLYSRVNKEEEEIARSMCANMKKA